jgi:hypothetical protein
MTFFGDIDGGGLTGRRLLGLFAFSILLWLMLGFGLYTVL